MAEAWWLAVSLDLQIVLASVTVVGGVLTYDRVKS